MTRIWKSLALIAAMGLLLEAGSSCARAGGSSDEVKDPVLKKLTSMEKRLDDAFRKISEDMTAVKAETLVIKKDLQEAQDKVDQLQKELSEARRDAVQLRIEVNELKKRGYTSTRQALYPPEKNTASEAISDRLAKIEQDLARMSTSLRVANSPPSAAVVVVPGARVRLVNDSFEELLFVLNGRTYRVAPGMMQVLEQMPSGQLTYEVLSPTWGVRGRNSPTLQPGETLTLTAPQDATDRFMIVTIDGPAGAGKSSAARVLAQRLGFEFLDTGAMYRAVTLAGLRAGLDLTDQDALARLMDSISLVLPAGRVLLGGEDVSDAIRTAEVTSASGAVASSPVVRRRLVEAQRTIAAGRNIVCEGRDQGTVVFPEAGCKFFLVANPEERARRRQGEMLKRGEQIAWNDVLRAQQARDQRDLSRVLGPMVPAADAILLDSTRLGLDEVVQRMEDEVRKRLSAGGSS